MRLAASLDNRLVIWWMDGLRYGVVDARARLLYGMKVGMFQQFFPPAGRQFLNWTMFELTYYTDLATGELLEEFANPYTRRDESRQARTPRSRTARPDGARDGRSGQSHGSRLPQYPRIPP